MFVRLSAFCMYAASLSAPSKYRRIPAKHHNRNRAQRWSTAKPSPPDARTSTSSTSPFNFLLCGCGICILGLTRFCTMFSPSSEPAYQRGKGETPKHTSNNTIAQMP